MILYRQYFFHFIDDIFTMLQHHAYLKQALALAKLRKGFCSPNPAVGAVVVRDGEIISTGYHEAAGSPHAEAVALDKLKDEAQGATLYVTLEPCCHYGRTPPCTELLIAKKIKNVFYGFVDPNPQVRGLGIAALQQAGIECEKLSLDDIDEFYASYAHWRLHKKPYVTAKLALSLDGKIAGRNGLQVKISGAAAQHFTHQRRQDSDAILTSVKTICQDDPQLNVRLTESPLAKPVYILDSYLRFPSHAKVSKTASSVTLFHSAAVEISKIKLLEEKGIHCVPIEYNEAGFKWEALLNYFGEIGVHDLWIEAGGRVFESLIAANILNKAYVYVAPISIGADGYSSFNKSIEIANKARSVKWHSLDQDGLCEIRW